MYKNMYFLLNITNLDMFYFSRDNMSSTILGYLVSFQKINAEFCAMKPFCTVD